MNPFKEYFKYFTDKYNINYKDFWYTFFIDLGCFVIGGLLILIVILGKEHDQKKMKEIYNKSMYELVIIDKYDYLGSHVHFIGGRKSEEEFHIVYKIYPISEYSKSKYYDRDEIDVEVSPRTYKKLNIGQKIKGHYQNLKDYYN